MVQLRVMTGPPVLIEVEIVTSVAEIPETRGVADRRIKPDVEILVVGARNAKAEIRRITRNIPVLQTGLEPLLELG